MANRSRLNKQIIQNQVFQLELEGRSEREILDKLGISYRTLARYHNDIHNKFINDSLDRNKEDLIARIEVARARLALPLQVNQNIMNNPKSTDRAKIDAANSYSNIAISLLKIETAYSNYIEFLQSTQRRVQLYPPKPTGRAEGVNGSTA